MRRWVMGGLVAAVVLGGVGGTAMACYPRCGNSYPRVSVRYSAYGGGDATSYAIRAGNVSIPGVVVPIVGPRPGGPIGDVARQVGFETDAGVGGPGTVFVGPTVIRKPKGDISVPGVVGPIVGPTPSPGPIGDKLVAKVAGIKTVGPVVVKAWERAKDVIEPVVTPGG